MNYFPAQYSTLSPVALKDHVETNYGLELSGCRLFSRNVSDTYLLEGPKHKYILRIYRSTYRPLSEIKGEIELLDILRDNAVPVSYPIADRSGKKIQNFEAIEGIRYGILFSYAVGKPVMIPDQQQLKIIGKEIAMMHHVTAGLGLKNERPVYDILSTLEQPLEKIRQRFEGLADEYERLRNVAAKTIAKLNQLDTTAFSYGYCHYDLLPKNFHFDENNNITFFDFDWCGQGFLVNDLMTFKVQLFFLIQFKAITAEAAEEMFAVMVGAYRQHRYLSEAELKAIALLGVGFFVFAFGFYEANYDDFAINFLIPRFMKDRVALIESWANSYCDF